MANIIADELSQKERIKPLRVRALGMIVQNSLIEQIRIAQDEALKEDQLEKEEFHGNNKNYEKNIDEIYYFKNRVWIPTLLDLQELILDEAHKSKYSIRPGTDKMYKDVKEFYWWPGMNKDIATY
ncbi:uncharacterized protein LOC143595566, partial [Bidens hawaiensis]|uniref:uncharacterized protein LOC143595566 n=1 Tax=Bidens hawaiensis TaxID=980011 RepID=UPI0040496312